MRRGFGPAWVALCLAFAAHVPDEARNNFLSVYNPAVRALREKFPLLPLPTFTFELWLAGQTLAVVALLAISPFAFRGGGWIVLPAYAYAAIMLGNGLLHLLSSVWMGRVMPGTYSAPLLPACSVYLLVCLRRGRPPR